MKLLICGGRNYQLTAQDYAFLDGLHAQYCFKEVVQGYASGADKYATLWGMTRGVRITGFHPDWVLHGRAAGPIRNAQMVAYLDSTDIVVAFPGGKGTADMVNKAREKGISVLMPTQQEALP